MRQHLWVFFGLICVLSYGQKRQVLSGRVSDGSEPLPDVTIQIAGTEQGTFSAADGTYEIRVSERDTVIFSSVGFKPYRYLVEDVSRFHNPILLPDIVELDEVVVKKSRRKSQADLFQEYPYNKNLFQTAFGIIDAETSANQIRVIPGDQIYPVGTCILDYLRSRFAGIRVAGNCQDGGRVLLRGGVGSLTQQVPLIWDVDGMIFRETPIWIPMENIERMAIVAGLGLTARYGQGGGGLIIINTKSFSPKKNTEEFDLARLRNNYLREDLPGAADLARNSPSYLNHLQSAPDFPTAKERYDSLETRYAHSPYFLLDAYQVFSERFGDLSFADSLLAENKKAFNANPVVLKALAYLYEAQGRWTRAEAVYEEVFRLRPRYVQSYLDMARVKQNLGQAGRALALLQRYTYLVDEGYLRQDTAMVQPFYEREWNNLLSQNRQELISASAYSELYLDPDEEATGLTRIVVEWNHSDADFELQFVNPGDQYYTWKHSIFEDAESIMEEKILGFNSREFILDKSLTGQWRINVKYLGNKALTPTYLKITRYDNYGTSRQQAYVSTHKLQIKNLNYELLSMNNSALVASE